MRRLACWLIMEGKIEDPEEEAGAIVLNSAAPVIRTLEEWDAWKDKQDKPVLLQCGSPKCVRCPAFSAQIVALETEFRFHYVYCNTHDAEEDLLEELRVTQLPAFFLVHKDEMTMGQSSKPDDVTSAIYRMCSPKLVLDGDF